MVAVIALRIEDEKMIVTLSIEGAMSDLVRTSIVIEDETPHVHVVRTGSAKNENNKNPQ